jgi:photosystem II stability/assembly factor-like uncharacterized protein
LSSTWADNGLGVGVRKFGRSGNTFFKPTAMGLDVSGNVYVTGRADDITTVRYTLSGDTTGWVEHYGEIGSGDIPSSIAVDASSNVYVAGTTSINGTNDYFTLKYSSGGIHMWDKIYDGTGHGDDEATSIAVDASGNVYVTGYSYDITNNYDYVTIKYNTSGVQVWLKNYDGPVHGADKAMALKIDNAGFVYVTGYSKDANNSDYYATIKYDQSGNPSSTWPDIGYGVGVRRYNNGHGIDRATAIAVDNIGNVFVTGYSYGSFTLEDYATLKYKSSGEQLWVKRYNGTGNGYDKPVAIAVDKYNNVYVTGKSTGSSGLFDYTTIKYGQESKYILAALGNGPFTNSSDTGAGLYRSSNYGVNWAKVSSDIISRCDDAVLSVTGDTVYAVGNGISVTQYAISYDAGHTFTFKDGPSDYGARRYQISICKSFPNVLYIAAYFDNINPHRIRVYKSTDAGLNFSFLANFPGQQVATEADLHLYIYTDPNDSNITYIGSQDIFKTTDGGTSFTNITQNTEVHPDQHGLDFNPLDPNKIICANDGGVWKSDNGGTTWNNLNDSLTTTQFYSVSTDPSNINHIIGGTQDNGTQSTINSGSYWSEKIGGDGGEVCFRSQYTNNVLGEYTEGVILRSTNGGGNFSLAITGLTGNSAWIAPIVSHINLTGIFYTARQRVFKTTDDGLTWNAVSPILNGDSAISALAISHSNSSIKFASSNYHLYKTTDDSSWPEIMNTNIPHNTITGIQIHPANSNIILITLSGFENGSDEGYVYKSTDGGVSWNNTTNNLPQHTPMYDILFYYPGYETNTYLVAAHNGVYISSNSGSSWQPFMDGLPKTISMRFDHYLGYYYLNTDKIRVATHGRGIWETSMNPSAISKKSNDIPIKFNLSQNYPNPFNPVTKIKYDIPKTARVSIKVYDILGREIAALVNEEKQPGYYEAVFNGSNFASGVYFYRINAGNYNAVKKMVLVK